MDIGTWELLSYIVTTIGLPLAILVFLYEQKKERDNEEEEVYQLLSDNYQDFLKIALDHPDLHLFTPEQTPELNEEQRERMLIIFNMLISLFERAYLLLYEPKMNYAAAAPLAIVGGLHARVVQARRVPRAAARAARGRRRRVRRLYPRARREESPTGSLLLSSRDARCSGALAHAAGVQARSASRDCLRGRRTRTSGSSGRGSAAAPPSTAPCTPSDP